MIRQDARDEDEAVSVCVYVRALVLLQHHAKDEAANDGATNANARTYKWMQHIVLFVCSSFAYSLLSPALFIEDAMRRVIAAPQGIC